MNSLMNFVSERTDRVGRSFIKLRPKVQLHFKKKCNLRRAIFVATSSIGIISFHTPMHAQQIISTSNMTGVAGPWGGAPGFYADQDHKMVCGMPSPSRTPSVAYSFSRFQLGASDKLIAMHYSISPTGIVSSNPALALDRRTVNFTAVGADPYPNTLDAVKNNTYIFGGGRSGIFSNEFFRYNGTAFTYADGLPISGPPPISSPYRMGNGLISGRAGMTGVSVGGNKIFLFGGHDGVSMRTEAYLFDRVTYAWTSLANMPMALQNARALSAAGPSNFASGGPSGVSWVYVVGGGGITGADALNRKIFRYDLNVDKWIVIQDSSGQDIAIPGDNHIEVASVQGAMLLLTQGSASTSDGNMHVYKLTHPSTVTYAAAGLIGTGKGSTLTSKTISLPARARSGFALMRCSPDTWVIGGAFGHGASFSNRGALIDKLTRN